MKKTVLDEETIKRSITRITFEIFEHFPNMDEVVLVGLKTRGITLAHRIQERIASLENIQIMVGDLDISYYRDDLKNKEGLTQPHLPFSLIGKHVVLVDDVLYTGRTIRAAMDAIMSMGRAKSISLAVLVDRGHRELPLRPDYVGKNIPTSKEESIKVELKENDGLDAVSIIKED